MDRIAVVLKCQWRAYWRRFRGSGNLRANNVGAIVLLGGLAAVRYVQQLPLAASQLERGETARFETLLIVVFLVWMVPVMGESRRSISTGTLLHFPLASSDLFLIRVGSVFCSPLSWIIVALSLALGYPIAVTEHPVTGALGLLTFFAVGIVCQPDDHALVAGCAGEESFACPVVGCQCSGRLALDRKADSNRAVFEIDTTAPSCYCCGYFGDAVSFAGNSLCDHSILRSPRSVDFHAHSASATKSTFTTIHSLRSDSASRQIRRTTQKGSSILEPVAGSLSRPADRYPVQHVPGFRRRSIGHSIRDRHSRCFPAVRQHRI